MTKNEILFNYRKAIRQAERLEEIAGKIEHLSKVEMAGTIGTLKDAWKSDNSHLFYSRMGKVQDEIRGDAASIIKVARSIRTTAESIKRAELRALEIAKTRTYR